MPPAWAQIFCAFPNYSLKWGYKWKNVRAVAESVPGYNPTDWIGGKKHGMYVIYQIHERDGEAIYNTAMLIGRNGEIVGKY
ncbi:hypothetical protein KEJ19_03480 [Candidatus Bathyarchaeota archaeon]|nr:hypothetical protein [Candidatus Bathyarchaeota archaeon]